MEEHKNQSQDDLELQEEVIEDLEVEPEKAEEVQGGAASSFGACHGLR